MTASTELTEVLLVQPTDAAGIRLRTALTSHREVAIVDEVRDTSAAIGLVTELRPDVIVIRVALSDVAESGVLGTLRDVAQYARLVLHADVAPSVAPGSGRWADRVIHVVIEADGSATLEARLEFLGEARSVTLSRNLLTQLIGRWDGEDFVDLAAVLMTELVANAIRHVPGPCAVELSRRGDALRMAVIDSGQGMPELRVPSDLSGRGMHIIASLSTAWGVDRLDDGSKVVWAELEPPSEDGE